MLTHLDSGARQSKVPSWEDLTNFSRSHTDFYEQVEQLKRQEPDIRP